MNVRSIRKITHNLQILQSQNDLQESLISELVHYLNLTMTQVHKNSGVLCELNTKLLVFSNTLAKTMEAMNYLCYMTSGTFSLKEKVGSFYKYMWVLANHEVDPLVVPPSKL